MNSISKSQSGVLLRDTGVLLRDSGSNGQSVASHRVSEKFRQQSQRGNRVGKLERLQTRRRVAGLKTKPHSPKQEMDRVRDSLENSLGGFRQTVIGITGVLGNEKTQALATVLAQSVAINLQMTATVCHLTREDVLETAEPSDEASWDKIQLNKGKFNAWPNRPVKAEVRYQINSFELLRWLRRESDFSLITFNTLGEVIDRMPFVRRLDGLVVVNSGKAFDQSVMSEGVRLLADNNVRMLGQLRNTDASAGQI